MALENNKRIAKNTILLYMRMLVLMLISLYTSRVILRTLGVEDYGIYNVVGGVIAMFSILSRSISSAISRFITFELGREDFDKLKKIFSTSVTIQIGIAIVIFILTESIGVWFLNTHLNISPERLVAANWVLQCSIATFIIDLISIPYNAAIIAHEDMKAFAYISLFEATAKLIVVLVLQSVLFDKLIVYSLLLLFVSFLVRITYGIYCKRYFQECRYEFVFDKPLLKEMTSFSVWNFIGTTSAILKGQGVNIAINIFCGPAVNAARGLAAQINNQVRGFATNFMTALNPQITKSYASGQRESMMTLIVQGGRFSYYILLIIALPIIIKADIILSLWLKEVPEHTVLFVQLALIEAIIDSISGPLITAMMATGKIRNYQITVGGIQMMSFPLSYYSLYLGFFPEVTMIIAILISISCLFARLIMLKRMIGMPLGIYVKNVLLNLALVSSLSCILPLLLNRSLEPSIASTISICLVCTASTVLVILYIGCTTKERAFVFQKINKLLK
uniref:lipopolysaccharide biosynthesis protein n=1 Tax=Bacteroides uniformis TaxID=820 RepID=UPI004028862A